MPIIKNFKSSSALTLPDAPISSAPLTITSQSKVGACLNNGNFTTINASLTSGSSNVIHFCSLHSDGSFTEDTVTVSGGQSHSVNITNYETFVAGYFYMTGTIGTNLLTWLS